MLLAQNGDFAMPENEILPRSAAAWFAAANRHSTAVAAAAALTKAFLAGSQLSS
jgi:hypothetical protein